MIEIPRPVPGEQIPCQLLQVFESGRSPGVSLQGEKAGEDPFDVSVQGRVGLFKGNAEDSARRVLADAGELGEGLKILREFSAVLGEDHPGRLVQVPRTGVVAHPLPDFQDGFRGRGGENLQVWKTFQEFSVVGKGRLDLGLMGMISETQMA